jgi:hypothetical protein
MVDSWCTSIDMGCILLHERFEGRLPISVLRNKATIYKTLGFKTDEFVKVLKSHHREALCLHIIIAA